jgi:crotonobetainyl-CoA:carnitine CoA-transferase CaiB-like acyl-CoA transferase
MVMTDHITGLVAAQAIGFALYRRERAGGGRGEAIEVSMFETMAGFVAAEHLGAATFDPPEGPAGDNRLLSAEYRPLPTKDGFITVAPNTNVQAFAFFDAIGRPELKADPRFATPVARTDNAAAYFDVRVAGLRQRATAEWLEIFSALDVPAARYNTIEDLLEDPHLADAGFWQSEEHPTEGRLRRARAATRFGGGERGDVLSAPCLGQHTREVLAEAGFGEAEIARMLESGAARGP